jgi:hypothetical protein
MDTSDFSRWMDREEIRSISRSLTRIADAIELLTCDKHPTIASLDDELLSYDDILCRVPMHHVNKSCIAKIVFENQHEHPKDIFARLVKAGAYSKKTYWKNVEVLWFIASKYSWDLRQKATRLQ